ncbi:hypothetical protein BRADI_3g48845v3 [Brachypodium distachyon]|uniref:Uncharacterized protein n=1 Tax=Brachypodium distachyon TaxID=15368 RepID=A0A0Q3M7D7_BRADI|nr:hypothetical protein BRADI_3g48845v3 [Brachypodium distachyon]
MMRQPTKVLRTSDHPKPDLREDLSSTSDEMSREVALKTQSSRSFHKCHKVRMIRERVHLTLEELVLRRLRKPGTERVPWLRAELLKEY